MRLPRRLDGAPAALVAGAALTLAQPPLGVWPALFVAWPVLFHAVGRAASPGRAARRGFAAGLGFFGTGLYWVGEAFLVEAGKVWWYLPLMPVAVAALAAACAAFWALGFAAARFVWPGGWRAALTLGAAVGLADALRGVALTGFPWALQAYAWIGAPPIQAAALTGSLALSGLTVAAAALPAAASRAAPWPALASLALLALAWGAGALRLAGAETAPTGPPIRLVQPSTPQADKWDPDNTGPIFDRLLALTAAPADAPPALVVWPEVAVTFLIDRAPDAVAAAVEAAGGAALAVGAVRLDDEDRYRNSLHFFDPDGTLRASYDKRRLAPFGEYVPYAWILGRIGLGTLGDGLSGFAPGERAMAVAPPGLPPGAPLICYEVIFPRLVADAADGADWLLQVTNDAWFGRSAGPWQHLAQAQARAVEQGLPVARAANTGVSAFIDPYGRIVASLPLEARGVLDSPLPGAPVATAYAVVGDGPWLAFLAIVAAAVRLGREPATVSG